MTKWQWFKWMMICFLIGGNSVGLVRDPLFRFAEKHYVAASNYACIGATVLVVIGFLMGYAVRRKIKRPSRDKNDAGTITAKLTLDTSGFDRALKDAREQLAAFAENAKKFDRSSPPPPPPIRYMKEGSSKSQSPPRDSTDPCEGCGEDFDKPCACEDCERD